MQTRLLCTIGIGLILQSAPVVQGAQKSDSERHVFVTALDKAGIPIVGLTTEHFAVRESGRDRTVVAAEPLRTPMHVAVLVDTSVANGTPDEAFRSAVLAFIAHLAAANQVAVYPFGDRVSRITGYTQDGAQLAAAAKGMFGWSHQRSHLIDAIDMALRDLESIESPRPVIVAINSEAPEASGGTAGATIKRLIAQSVAFHALSLAGGAGPTQAQGVTSDIPTKSARLGGLIAAGEGERERTRLIEQGTAATGGGRQRVTSTLAIGAALGRVAGELSNSYKVTFTRAGSGKMQDLQVGVMIEGITLRATPAPFGTR